MPSEETVNQDMDKKTAEEGQTVRTFTQDEVNAIVKDRLAREQEKFADYEDLKSKAAKYDEAEEANKTELQKATEKANSLQAELNTLKKANEMREIRDKVAKETGVPADLLSGDTEEACKAQAEAILKFAKPQTYPNVHDGGEIHTSPSRKTRDQFAEWFNESIKR